MNYIIPRERDGSLSTTMVEQRGDDGSVRCIPLVEGNSDAVAFARWKEEGGVPEEAPAPGFPADDVKAECGRRIYAVASDNAQKNMLATIVADGMSAADKATFAAGVTWIAAMQASCRDMIVAADQQFADDSKWPAIPPGVAELAARF